MQQEAAVIAEDLVTVSGNAHSLIRHCARQLSEQRDANRGNYEIGRNLSLAITHLEDAEDRIRRALWALPAQDETNE